MQTLLPAIATYFDGERAEAIALAVACAGLLVGAAALVATRDRFAGGLAIVLALSAIVGLSTALPLLRRDAAHRVTLSAAVQATERARAVSAERVRMDGVVSRYAWYRYGYVALVGIAAALGVFSRAPRTQGIAVGLLIFAAIGFTVDHFSEARAERYRDALGEAVG
ncbi:MAG: hypothetical protein MUF00_09705 [Gemmatimonadaceae bacterium]|jgi:hypothetical protein|nr:hypothetical protein [Gemmatimonadaceae bacterium]